MVLQPTTNPRTSMISPDDSTHPPAAPARHESDQARVKLAEDAEIACWRAALLAPSVRLRARLGLRTVSNRWGHALVTASADHVMLNRVFLRPPTSGGEPRALEELLSLHRSEGVDRFFVHVSERIDPRLAPQLRAAGLVRYPRSWVKLGCSLRKGAAATPALPAPHPRAGGTAAPIRPLTAREAGRFAELMRRCFDLPQELDAVFRGLVGAEGFDALGAFAGDQLCAVGLMYSAEGTAYLAGGATDPEHRRRGFQSALIRARLDLASARGCSVVCTETGEERPGQPQHSQRNLQRHGLVPLAVRHNYALSTCSW